MEINTIVQNVADDIIIATMHFGKDLWNSFSYDEKKDIRDLALAVAKARFQEWSGEDVKDIVATLDAAVLQWKVAGKQEAVSAFKKGTEAVIGYGGQFLGGLLRGFVGRM